MKGGLRMVVLFIPGSALVSDPAACEVTASAEADAIAEA